MNLLRSSRYANTAGLGIFLLLTLTTAAQDANLNRVALPVDWSHRHIIYTASGPAHNIFEAQRDVRFLHSWVNRRLSEQRSASPNADAPASSSKASTMQAEALSLNSAEILQRHRSRRLNRQNNKSFHRDWSMSLNNGSVSKNSYPAKYVFDINAAASCANDFLVTPVNINGGAGQANLVAFRNLYSGSAGGNGKCGTTNPTVYWAYNTGATPNAGSPVLSLDGTQVALVSGSNPASFLLLKWSATGSILLPTTPGTPAGTNRAAAGQMTSLALTGGGISTNASPFIDYANDVAYVSTNNGHVFRVRNVFCTTPACQTTPVAPSIDASWGTAVTAGTGILTGPVYDSVSKNIFVGSDDGSLYAIPVNAGVAPGSAATAGAVASLALGSGSGQNTGKGIIADPPIVDSLNARVYVSSGDDNNTNAPTAYQLDTALNLLASVTIGQQDTVFIHSGAFSDAYFSQVNNGAGANEFIYYVCGYDSNVANNAVIYGLHFSAGSTRTMLTTGVSTFNLTQTGTAASRTNEECSPLTTFKNGATERLFYARQQTNEIDSVNITTGPPLQTQVPARFSLGATQTLNRGGTSGIVVDNVDPDPQASSIYFGAPSQRTVVKLTQAGLQ